MLKKLFKKKNPEKIEYRVTLPEDRYAALDWEEDSLPIVAMLNIALKDFEPKKIFGWHLSVIIDFEETAENGMPSEDESKIVNPFCDRLEDEICAGGNALFLVRETWNKTRRLVWRVHNPEIANKHLQSLIEHKLYPRQFDFHMEPDLEWKEAAYYFGMIPT